MKPMMETQVIIGFERRTPLAVEALDDLADAVLTALNERARFIAFGPVVSVNYPRSAVEVECTVCTDSEAEVDGAIERIRAVVHEALAAEEYSTSEERTAVPA